MPGGGNKYRQWYAMRARLRAAGEWQAHQAGLSGLSETARAAQEDVPDLTEPAADDDSSESESKRPRLDEGESSDDSIPDLESSPTAEGKYLPIVIFIYHRCLCGRDLLDSLSYLSALGNKMGVTY